MIIRQLNIRWFAYRVCADVLIHLGKFHLSYLKYYVLLYVSPIVVSCSKTTERVKQIFSKHEGSVLKLFMILCQNIYCLRYPLPIYLLNVNSNDYNLKDMFIWTFIWVQCVFCIKTSIIVGYFAIIYCHIM